MRVIAPIPMAKWAPAGYDLSKPAWAVYAPQNDFASFTISVMLLVLVTIGAVWYNHVAQDNLPLTPFFLLPITYSAWFIKKRGLVALLIAFTTFGLYLATYAQAHTGLGKVTPLILQTATYIMVAFLVSHLRSGLESERYYSRRDSLTGVLNMRGFFEVAEVEMERMSRRSKQLPVSVAIFDVDNFKQVNDTFGHKAGDEALCTLTRAVISHLRRTDSFARVGGDEFTLLLPETDEAGASAMLHRMVENIRELSLGHLTCSVGCVTYETVEELDIILREADRAAYEAKEAGRDRIVSRKVTAQTVA